MSFQRGFIDEINKNAMYGQLGKALRGAVRTGSTISSAKKLTRVTDAGNKLFKKNPIAFKKIYGEDAFNQLSKNIK